MTSEFGQLATGIRKKWAQKCGFYCQHLNKVILQMNTAIIVVMCANSVIHIHFHTDYYKHTQSLIHLLSTSHIHPTQPVVPRAITFASSEKRIGVTNKAAD